MKPKSKPVNILVLMAGGGGSAFKEAGYLYPKNLIEIEGTPLVEHIIRSLENLSKRPGTNVIFMVDREECQRFHTKAVIKLLVPDAKVIEVPAPTSGAACTALLAVESIDSEVPLLIVNGDELLRVSHVELIEEFDGRDLDGGVVVFESVHPRWSYVKCDEDGLVVETAEKKPISNLATGGCYYFRKGKDFVTGAMNMIRKDAHLNGLFYICPAYNEMILRQKRIGIKKVPRNMHFSLKSPQAVEEYVSLLRSEERK